MRQRVGAVGGREGGGGNGRGGEGATGRAGRGRGGGDGHDNKASRGQFSHVARASQIRYQGHPFLPLHSQGGR